MIGTVVNSVNSAAGMGVVVGTSGSAPLQRVTFAAPPDRHGGFASAHPGKEGKGGGREERRPLHSVPCRTPDTYT